MSRRAPRWAGPALGLAAVLAVVVGVTLIVTGGEDSTPRPTTTTTAPERGSDPTLPLAGRTLTVAEVEALAGVDVPDSATDFLSAQLDDHRQLDVTFTIPSGDVEAFITGSGLPRPREGRRVVAHSSPLWQLNPDGAVSGSRDVQEGIARAVEVIDEGDRTRVRLVISPA